MRRLQKITRQNSALLAKDERMRHLCSMAMRALVGASSFH